MIRYCLSEHAGDMLRERNIKKAWIQSALDNPEMKEIKEDGTIHHIIAVEDNGEKYLRVIINPTSEPIKIVTVFFDRRLRRAK
jgi:hypothetical protein